MRNYIMPYIFLGSAFTLSIFIIVATPQLQRHDGFDSAAQHSSILRGQGNVSLAPVSHLNPPFDYCLFPEHSLSWQRPIYSRLETDLRKYSNMGVNERVEYIRRCKNSHGSCTFVSIRKSQILIVQSAPGFENRNLEILMQLERVLDKFSPMPDLDFAIDHDDGMSDTGYSPIFMLCSFIQAPQGIMIPDFSFFDWPTSRCPGEQSRLFEDFVRNATTRLYDLKRSPNTFINKKRNDLFWRGAALMNTRREKQLESILNASGQFNQSINARLMNWDSPDLSTECVTMHDHCDHRFLLHLQGNTYSSRLKYLLLCGSIVFMPQQEYEEWWHPAIPSLDMANEDNEILVHLRGDVSDFEEKFAEFHSEDSGPVADRIHRMSHRVLQFATEVFSERSVDCYWGSVLIGAARAWGRLLDKDVGVTLDELLLDPFSPFSNL